MADTSPFVIKPDEREPLDTPHHENMVARELVNPDHGSDNVVFRITEIEPGKRAVDDWHVHDDIDQLVYVLEGVGRLRMSETGDDADAVSRDIEPDTFVFLPSGTYHNIWSAGETTLRMIVIWAPPYESFDDWDVND